MALGYVNQRIGTLVRDFKSLVSSRTQEAFQRFESAQGVFEAIGSVSELILGKVFKSEAATKALRFVSKAVETGSAIAKIGADIFKNGISAIFTGDILGSIGSLFGLGGPSIEEQKLDQVIAMLEQLGEFMEVVREEMHERFDRIEMQLQVLDRKLDHVIQRIDNLFRAVQDGFQSLDKALRSGLYQLETHLRGIEKQLHGLEQQVRDLHDVIQWFADEAAMRAMDSALIDYESTLAKAAAEPAEQALGSLADAKVKLLALPRSSIFSRLSPISRMLQAPPLLAVRKDRWNDPLFSSARIGILGGLAKAMKTQSLPFSGLPANFDAFHYMARRYVDTLNARPELFADRGSRAVELSGIRARSDTIRASTVESLRILLAGPNGALEALRYWSTETRRSMQLQSGFMGAWRFYAEIKSVNPRSEGDEIDMFLDNEYAGPHGFMLTLRDELDRGFLHEPDARRYNIYQYWSTEWDHGETLRHLGGYDFIRIAICLGLISLEDTYQQPGVFAMKWRFVSPFTYPRRSPYDLHGKKVGGNAAMRFYAYSRNGGGVKGLITAAPIKFMTLYNQIRGVVSTYLKELRNHLIESVDKSSVPSPVPALKHHLASLAMIRFITELTLEAGRSDAQLVADLRPLLDDQRLFSESMLSLGRAGTTPALQSAWEKDVVEALKDHLRNLTQGSHLQLPKGLRFFHEVFDDLAAFGLEYEKEVRNRLLPYLEKPGLFRFAAVDEIEAAARAYEQRGR